MGIIVLFKYQYLQKKIKWNADVENITGKKKKKSL